MEHCLKAVSLVYNRLGTPGVQENQDFDFLLEGESREELVDLMMTTAGFVALVLEDIVPIYDSLIVDGLLEEDSITQATTVLDSIRDMLVNQAVNELA